MFLLIRTEAKGKELFDVSYVISIKLWPMLVLRNDSRIDQSRESNTSVEGDIYNIIYW